MSQGLANLPRFFSFEARVPVETSYHRGHVHMMSAVGGGEGGTPKADAVREVA